MVAAPRQHSARGGRVQYLRQARPAFVSPARSPREIVDGTRLKIEELREAVPRASCARPESNQGYRDGVLRVGRNGSAAFRRLRQAGALGALVALVAAVAAGAWPGPPTGAAPKLDQPGPPPAWVESTTFSRWLAFSSYCWKTSCVDMLPPATRPDLPVFRPRRDQLLRFHLRFLPTQAKLTVLNGGMSKQYRLRPARVLTWRAAKGGILTLAVHASSGSASYVIRLVLR